MESEALIRAVLSLIFVVALIGIVAYLFQKFAIDKKLMSKSDGKKLKVLEYQVIDSKRRLALIGYKDKEILLLLSPNGETVVDKEETPSKKKSKKK